MSNLLKIVLTAIFGGFISAVIALICAAIMFLIFLSHVGIFTTGTSYTQKDIIISLICLCVLVISLFICPSLAYYIRQNIFSYTDNSSLQTVLFAIVAGAQIITLFLAYCSSPLVFRTYGAIAGYRHERKFAPFNNLARRLDEADVKVNVKKARVLSDDGKVITAEITLQIENVPLIMPYYEFDIFELGNDSGFLIPFNRMSNDKIPNSYLKAVNQNGKWIFRDINNTTVSENSDAVTIRVEILREPVAKTDLPKTISPRLGMWKKKDDVYLASHVFFNQRIPIEFE